ncbi:MAG: hypothetical protein AB7T49_05570 [Oligoflexales bacterium]
MLFRLSAFVIPLSIYLCLTQLQRRETGFANRTISVPDRHPEGNALHTGNQTLPTSDQNRPTTDQNRYSRSLNRHSHPPDRHSRPPRHPERSEGSKSRFVAPSKTPDQTSPRTPFKEQLESVGISEEMTKDWFAKGEPERVNFWSGTNYVIWSNEKNPGGLASGKGRSLYLSDVAAIAEIRKRREAEENDPKKPKQVNHSETLHKPRSSEEWNVEKEPIRLSESAYRVKKFRRGLCDDGKTISQRGNLNESAQGPDYDLGWIDPDDKVALENVRAKAISLGHGGEITFEILGGGYLEDLPGADFVIFENPFRVAPELVFQEFAMVGVAQVNKKNAYVWFECSPNRGDILHCAGVVPTDEGGDRFDLASVGMNKVRYIKIRDTKTNYNNYNIDENTEGFDLDALTLLNAFSDQE